MKLCRYIFPLLVVAAAYVSDAYAQNLDPTVVVDRAYEGKLMEVHKPSLEMAVPDTVMKFDLDFDYSVFDNPYKGSYEFSPYLLSMKPSASADVSRRLYLSAGAGYQLHPELDLVWSPEFRNKGVAVDVYANHRSYIGTYLPCIEDQGTEAWSGNDFLSKAGADFSYDWEKGAVSIGAGYYGLASKDFMWQRSYNAADASFGISSKSTAVSYSVEAAYRYASDGVGKESVPVERMVENVADVDVSLGFPVRGSSIVLDLGADYASYSGYRTVSGGQFYVTPHYVWKKKRFVADLGVRVAKTFTSDGNVAYGSKGQFVYPDVKLEFIAVPDALKIWAKADGGNVTDTYASLLASNHHLNMRDRLEDRGFLNFTSVRVDASAGLSGRIASRFSFDVYAGYADYMNGLLDCMILAPGGTPSYGVGYHPYTKWYAGTMLSWKGEWLTVDAALQYTGSSLTGSQPSAFFFLPAALTGDAAVRYNWKNRIYAGVTCGFSTMRSNAHYTAPAYADLGLGLEYVMNGRLSLWLKGGNLLGMDVQRNLTYAEKGPYFTVGIRLNL